jgi:transcriptional regulator with XRE-family HTH domain
MGKHPRPKQEHLGDKLLQIRRSLGLSQNGILRHLGLDETLSRTIISNYELGEREPPLYILLRYARAAGVCLDAIVDDKVELPDNLPSVPNHDAVMCAAKPKKREN